MNRQELFDFLKQSQGFVTSELQKAFEEVDRGNFVLPGYLSQAYEDHPLPIGYDATISQPTTVLFMLNLLGPEPAELILDVGAGSGWTTALLAHAVGKSGQVFGTELVPELVEYGNSNLKKYSFDTKIEQAIELGLPEHAPYDKILVSAAASDLPKELVDQLRVGGRLVLPIRNSVFAIDKVSEDKLGVKEYPGFAFVPLRPSRTR